MTVGGCDVVIHGSKVRCGGDEINMVIGVIVLLELDGVQAVADQRRGRRQLLE